MPGPQQFVPGSRRPATKSQQESLLSAPSYGEEDVAFRLSTSALLEEEIVAPHPSQSSSLPALDSFEHAGPLIITQDPRASSQVTMIFELAPSWLLSGQPGGCGTEEAVGLASAIIVAQQCPHQMCPSSSNEAVAGWQLAVLLCVLLL